MLCVKSVDYAFSRKKSAMAKKRVVDRAGDKIISRFNLPFIKKLKRAPQERNSSAKCKINIGLCIKITLLIYVKKSTAKISEIVFNRYVVSPFF